MGLARAGCGGPSRAQLSPAISEHMAHCEATGHAVQAPFQEGGPGEVFEFRLVPKVSQGWHPRKSSPSPEEDEGETCIICMESVPPDHALTSCGHHFHKSCLIRWKLVKLECPLCKHDLS